LEKWRHEAAWLAELPSLVLDCATLWRLELEQPIETPHSLVVPAGTAVLKLNAPSRREADHEADALACWSGTGAVRLLACDAARRALLCERCLPGTRLWDAANVDEAAVVAELLTTLRLVPQRPHPFRLLADEAERWGAELRERYRQCGQPFERSLLDVATDVCRSADRAAGFLVNEDLHGGNILKATRSPWLLIDPKPLVGERELDGVGLLRNAASHGLFSRGAVRRWLDVLAELGLDRARLRGWGVAHALAWGWHDVRGWSMRHVDIARRIQSA
jgi:streptomycin 6-kinase